MRKGIGMKNKKTLDCVYCKTKGVAYVNHFLKYCNICEPTLKEKMLRPMKDIEAVEKLNPPCADSCYTVENLRGHLDSALSELTKWRDLYESITANFTIICNMCGRRWHGIYKQEICPNCGNPTKAPASDFAKESLDDRNARLSEKCL